MAVSHRCLASSTTGYLKVWRYNLDTPLIYLCTAVLEVVRKNPNLTYSEQIVWEMGSMENSWWHGLDFNALESWQTSLKLDIDINGVKWSLPEEVGSITTTIYVVYIYVHTWNVLNINPSISFYVCHCWIPPKNHGSTQIDSFSRKSDLEIQAWWNLKPILSDISRSV